MFAIPALEDVVAVWRDVLRLSDADEDVSFLEHGGTSLTAVRIRAALQRQLALDVDVSALVDNPSPLMLVEYLEDTEGVG